MPFVQVVGASAAPELGPPLPSHPPGLGCAEPLGSARPLGLGILTLTKATRWGHCPDPGPRRQLVLTNHRGLDEAPRVALWNVRLEDACSSARLVHAPKHVDLASTHCGCCRVHCLGQRGHRLPLVGDGVIPVERGEEEPESDGPRAGQGPQARQQTRGSPTTHFLPSV